MTKHYDYIAIGGGSGGIASINRAAMYGQKCALIEAKELGGTCVNVGCVPKKVMWHAAQVREAIHMYGPDYGFDTTINKFDWDKLIATRTAYIDRIHTSYDNVLGKNNVDVIKGFARFVDAKTIEVNGETITADHILIATGGRPSHPNIPGVEYGIDSDGFFELPALPKRVAVVGAGYIAVELAGVINGLGSQTHLFVRKHAPLRSFDPLIVDTLVEVMNAEGPTLHTNAVPKAVVKNADGSLTLELEDGRSQTVDCLIWAIGREPANDNFNLGVTGVKTDALTQPHHPGAQDKNQDQDNKGQQERFAGNVLHDHVIKNAGQQPCLGNNQQTADETQNTGNRKPAAGKNALLFQPAC